ncbi:hypothetical protein MNBD_NITROSPINAE04-788 [hydrothermal vent metagenome]|uniref:SPOR domain-containing protein n=1 Tax=hydrothermal vent metagenome TaxID=652676 RepID=A0A3B1C8S9_9ZZZZ
MLRSRTTRLFIFSLMFAIALSFLLGYSSAKWFAIDTVPAPVTPNKITKKEPLKNFGIKPKKLDVDKITGKSQRSAPGEEQDTFTFTKTLKKDTAPAANPFARKEPPKQKKPKPEEKTKTVAAKPESLQPVKESLPSERKQEKLTVAKTIWPKKGSVKVKPSKPKRRLEKNRAVTGKVYTLQVGSFAALSNAKKLKRRIEKRGYHVYIQSFITRGKQWHSVRVGIYKTKSSAKRVAAQLNREMNMRAEVRNYRRGT